MDLYTGTHTCTHTNHLSCALFLAHQRKTNLIASLKNQHRRCTRAYRHLLRTDTDYSLFLLSKELHIANPPFTNDRTSAFLNLVVLSHSSSHANWPRAASTGRQAGTQIMTATPARAPPGDKKELIKPHERRTEHNQSVYWFLSTAPIAEHLQHATTQSSKSCDKWNSI